MSPNYILKRIALIFYTLLVVSLIVFAITSGLAAKLYKSYTEKQAASRSPASGSKPVARKPAARKEA